MLQHAQVIVIDHLGGESYWPYGTERGRAVPNLYKPLLMFSGDTSEDLNLLQKSTASQEHCRQLWRYLREGGLAARAGLTPTSSSGSFSGERASRLAASPPARPPFTIRCTTTPACWRWQALALAVAG